MQDYQRDFLAFALETGALKFGDFLLKSGRRSPYFFNAGHFDTGARLARLAGAYASRIIDSGIPFDCLYGPAYKGIPLAAATSIALAEAHGRDCPFAYNRKEVKDHGEGGLIVGRELSGRVLIIDDVITAGTSVRESIEIIRAQGAEAAAVVVALDRKEIGESGRSAVAEVSERFSIPVISIVDLDMLIELLQAGPTDNDALDALESHRARYGDPG